MARPVKPPPGFEAKGKHYYSMFNSLFEIDSKYVPIKPVGRGAYGMVCSSMNKETNQKVAIKKISDVFNHPVSALRALREMKLLRKIRHENVIALKDVMMPASRSRFKDLYLVYELMDTDLDRVIQCKLPLSSDHCRFFLFQLLEGLKYLHSVNVLHRDLKPGNLLVNANCNLKIGDFGLSRTMEENREPMTEYVVTRWYRAPELLLDCGRYGTCVDMWSVGCIFAEMLGKKPIFPGTDSLNQLHRIIMVLGTPREKDLEFIDSAKTRDYIKSLPFSKGINFVQLYPDAEPYARHLLGKMLVFNPNKRISTADALRHPYMVDLCNPNCAPPAKPNIDLDVDESIGEEKMRHMILKEILYHRLKALSL